VSVSKASLPRDVTAAKRQQASTLRLRGEGGKRITLKMSARQVEKVARLLSQGYAVNQQEVILRAIDEAAQSALSVGEKV
jgi:hypothetical protein